MVYMVCLTVKKTLVLEVRRLAGGCNSGGTISSLSLRVRGNRVCNFVKRGNTNGAAAVGSYYKVLGFSRNRVCISNISMGRGPLRYGRGVTCVPSGPSLCRFVANVGCLGFVTSVFKVDRSSHRTEVDGCTRVFRVGGTLTRAVSNCSRNVGRGLTVISTLVRGPGLVVVSRPFMNLSPGSSRLLGALVERVYSGNNTVFFSARILRITRGLYSGITVVGDNGLVGSNAVSRIGNSSSLRSMFLRLRRGSTWGLGWAPVSGNAYAMRHGFIGRRGRQRGGFIWLANYLSYSSHFYQYYVYVRILRCIRRSNACTYGVKVRLIMFSLYCKYIIYGRRGELCFPFTLATL